MKVINDFAPEHLLVRCLHEDVTQNLISKVKNCGEILWGKYTPFVAANYAIGITAVLPTNGFSKNISGITCRDMLKTTTLGALTRDALSDIRDTIRVFSEHENLPFHGYASEVRFDR
jgi:histidinol dehydrogenase